MPFYEYECSNCRFYVEVLQKISEQPLKKCPSCGKKTLKKLVSAPVFRLKGSGWYETDFKSDQEGKRNLAAADKEDTSTDKSEAKPAADADGKAGAKPDAKSEAADNKASSKADSKSESSPAASGRTGQGGTDKGSTGKSGRRGSSASAKSSKGKGKGSPAKRAAPSRPKASSKRRRGR
jgi:putative FmdB family regulatory protein